MSKQVFLRLGTVREVKQFQAHVDSLPLKIPCDTEIVAGAESPLRKPLVSGAIKIGNRMTAQPMEGWDGTTDGNPTESTIRRWRRFGRSGAKLIWGGEAVAVTQEGRANPHQLLIAPHTEKGLAQLRAALIEEHRITTGSDDGLLIGLQLTHSGRFSRPNAFDSPEPRIAYHHPILDARLGLSDESPLLTDSEIDAIIEKFVMVSTTVRRLGFDFVDLKHCHGYLGHELLGAHTRAGRYGGSFENRTRFLRNLVQGIRSNAPGLEIGVRFSAFDTVPFRHGVSESPHREIAPGTPERFDRCLPYEYGFGVNRANPVEIDLTETIQFASLLEELGVRLVNVTAGSPYYNPHIQRPALYPPSDGYAPPEDPLIGVARQMEVTRVLKQRFPHLIFVGSAYSYLQDFLPNVAQATVREGWVDSVGLGRMLLTYPEILWDATEGRPLQRNRICRTFSDCTTAPRKGLPSGCYPLDDYYKESPMNTQLQALKKR
jgi:2,4-dienoyl-CoA reductase-like NADH-dependent reductase (Old Yellow Enzyme family)